MCVNSAQETNDFLCCTRNHIDSCWNIVLILVIIPRKYIVIFLLKTMCLPGFESSVKPNSLARP